MARKAKKARRLVVDGETYLWSLRHSHSDPVDPPVSPGGAADGPASDSPASGSPASAAAPPRRVPRICHETLVLRRDGSPGSLRLAFRSGPGRLVPDGFFVPFGVVGTDFDRMLNLHEPGTVRAVLDTVLHHGLRPGERTVQEVDGWALFDEAYALRESTARAD